MNRLGEKQMSRVVKQKVRFGANFERAHKFEEGAGERGR